MPENTETLIEQQQWLEPLEESAQKAVAAAFESAGEAGRVLRNALHGTWLGHPLHPVLTDIPLGAWTAALVLDLMDAGGRRECRAGADVAVGVGLAGAGLAALAGVTDWHKTDGGARRIGLVHGLLNLVGTGLYAASLVERNRRNRGTGRSLAYAGFAVAGVAAYLGGSLVYGKKIGVDHSAPSAPSDDGWHDAGEEANLSEGKPVRVDVSGSRVLLLKQGTELFCMSEVCSHLGGPLAEGEIHDETVTCPWHGSRFSLRDGSVIDGPATHAQACWEARIQQGRVQVKARSQG